MHRSYSPTGQKLTLSLGLLVASLVAGCGENGNSTPAASPPPELLVLSNRADLISGGDALVEVKLPQGAASSAWEKATVSLNGTDVTSSFAVRGNGRYIGLISGLTAGANEIQAKVAGGAAKISVTNHSSGGPIFSGAQLEPWICATEPSMAVNVTGNAAQQATANTLASGLASNPTTNDPPGASKCEVAPVYLYYYKKATAAANCTFSFTSATSCFTAYTPGTPATVPADAADFTNDRGATVKYLIRVERGTANRGMYQLVTLFDPRDENTAWAPPKGWNQKVFWRFGGGGSASRFQTQQSMNTLLLSNALERGFMVVSASLTDGGSTTNNTISAETVMMVKERVTEQYGEIRYTMGEGGSGGSVMQHTISSSYPGLLNGLLPQRTFPDQMTVHIEITDCGLLQATDAQNPGSPGYYSRPGTGAALTDVQKTAINGHASPNFCNSWIQAYGNFNRPAAANCGSNFPAALRYNPTTNPQGVRCSNAEHIKSLTGTFLDTDGVTKAMAPFDNVGLQYGLKALQAGIISGEEFVALNENIGGYDLDLVRKASRMATDPAVLRTHYKAATVSDGRQLAKVPIIDVRYQNNLNGDVHMNWRPLSVRDRLDRDAGGHGNQIIWAAENVSLIFDESIKTMDAWLSAIEADTSTDPIQAKVLRHKPEVTGGSNGGDFCQLSNGRRVGLMDAACPIKYFSSPRIAAGGPMAENIYKCQLKPFDANSADYGNVVFTADQTARLQAVFPNGVCDWSKLGVEQVPVVPWTTFSAGPGGQALPDAPTSQPL